MPATFGYSIKINLDSDNTEIFNGYFSVLQANPSDIEGLVTHFYDATNPSVDIYINNGYYEQDSIYLINTNQFSEGGTVITSFPYFQDLYTDPSAAFYSLWLDNGIDTVSPLDEDGNVLEDKPVIFTITQISGPSPNPPIRNYLSMHSLFTNNAMVYYKKNSLAPCGVGSVSNSRSKSRKT